RVVKKARSLPLVRVVAKPRAQPLVWVVRKARALPRVRVVAKPRAPPLVWGRPAMRGGSFRAGYRTPARARALPLVRVVRKARALPQVREN
ncbi:MAG: hypothetical protein WBE94_22905, partial [Pseudolabrys sp.]